MTSRELIVYTDGACFPNPGRGGWGVVITDPSGEVRKLSGAAEGVTTSVRMEMTAILMAMRTFVDRSVPVLVRSDSLFVIRTLHGRYRRYKNLDLWNEIDAERRLFSSIRFEWIKGHAGEQYNEMADSLANDAAGILEVCRGQILNMESPAFGAR